MKNRELIEEFRRLGKEVMEGLPHLDVIKENIDIVCDELQIHYGEERDSK